MGSEGVAGTNGQPGRKVSVFPLLPVCFFPSDKVI